MQKLQNQGGRIPLSLEQIAASPLTAAGFIRVTFYRACIEVCAVALQASEDCRGFVPNAHVMRRAGSRRTSIVPKASCLDPFGCDIGTRSFDLYPLTHIVANRDPHCFGFLRNGNDVRDGPHVDSALVDLPSHLKILYDQ